MKDTIIYRHINIFAQRLKSLRTEKGYTQKELAQIIDCPPSLISYYENAKREPGFTNILKLCKVFQESPDYLFGLTDYRSVKKIIS